MRTWIQTLLHARVLSLQLLINHIKVILSLQHQKFQVCLESFSVADMHDHLPGHWAVPLVVCTQIELFCLYHLFIQAASPQKHNDTTCDLRSQFSAKCIQRSKLISEKRIISVLSSCTDKAEEFNAVFIFTLNINTQCYTDEVGRHSLVPRSSSPLPWTTTYVTDTGVDLKTPQRKLGQGAPCWNVPRVFTATPLSISITGNLQLKKLFWTMLLCYPLIGVQIAIIDASEYKITRPDMQEIAATEAFCWSKQIKFRNCFSNSRSINIGLLRLKIKINFSSIILSAPTKDRVSLCHMCQLALPGWSSS